MLEDQTKEYIKTAEQCDCDIRDLGKKIQSLEIEFDTTCNNLLANKNKHEKLDKELGNHEEENSALHRRVQLLEMEKTQTEEKVFMKCLNLKEIILNCSACCYSSQSFPGQ